MLKDQVLILKFLIEQTLAIGPNNQWSDITSFFISALSLSRRELQQHSSLHLGP